MLIGSPSSAFAFGISASQFEDTAVSPGPSHAAHPPAELRRGTLRWHPACDQQSQVPRASSTRSVVCAGSASAQRVWPSRLLDHKSTCVLVWSRGGPCIPWLQPRGFLAPMSVSTAAIQGYSNIAVMVIGERGAGCAALPFLCGFG